MTENDAHRTGEVRLIHIHESPYPAVVNGRLLRDLVEQHKFSRSSGVAGGRRIPPLEKKFTVPVPHAYARRRARLILTRAPKRTEP